PVSPTTFILSSSSAHHPHLHSFPTRRSSDLVPEVVLQTVEVDHRDWRLDVAQRPPNLPLEQVECSLGARRDLDRAHGPSIIESSDRKSTRLNSSHDQISYAVFCLKKKKNH